MTRLPAIVLLLPLVACHSTASDTTTPAPVGSLATHAAPRLTAALIDSGGRKVGQVSAMTMTSGVHFEIAVSGQAPGQHGMHLHAAAVCDPPAFTTATGHLNPASKQHGTRNPLGPHLGDLPNIVIDQQGTGRASVTVSGVTLNADPTIGAALVIHAAPDDERTDPTGNAGARIACAVIPGLSGAP
jgi:Cu-Zn family superoxide dismutase